MGKKLMLIRFPFYPSMKQCNVQLFGFYVDLLTPSATAIMYMRRCGIPFETIGKVTGHKNLESLIKHYDLTLEVSEHFFLALNDFF